MSPWQDQVQKQANKMPESHVSDLQYCSYEEYTKTFVSDTGSVRF